MERLTDKELRLSSRDINNDDDFNDIVYMELQKYEDFMESLGLENLEELEHIIGYPRFIDGYDEQNKEINKIEFRTYKESFNEEFNKNKKLKQENKTQKDNYDNLFNDYVKTKKEVRQLSDRWQKLKKLIVKEYNQEEQSVDEYNKYDTDRYMTLGAINGLYFVKNKMQELEKE